MYLLPAAQTKDKSSITPKQMKSLTERLKKEFDYILIDCLQVEQDLKMPLRVRIGHCGDCPEVQR